MGPVGSIGALRSHYGYTFRAEIFAYDIGRSTLRSALPTSPTTRANRKTAITVADLLNEGVFAVCGPGSPPNSPQRVVGSTLCHARGEADPVSGQLPGLRDCTSSLSPAAASTTPSPAMIAVYWSTQGTAARSLVCRRSRRRRHRYPRPVASRLPCYHAGTGAPAPWALLLGLLPVLLGGYRLRAQTISCRSMAPM